jgi:dihydroorotate dehydrogenase electron transfer subunit
MERHLDRPRIVKLLEKKKETELVTTLRFDDDADAGPGQYVMVWVPGVDEIPMSLTYLGPRKGIAVHAKGEATKALVSIGVGDRVGLRGPYGNGFRAVRGKALVVAGGTGIASLSPLIETLSKKGPKPTVVIGAKTAGELLYVKRVKKLGADVIITTDDGTEGRKGFATDAASEQLSKAKFKQVYTCGPEIMMKAVAEMGRCHHVPVQVSLERFMKCGIGICDACAVSGIQVCIEGPVFCGQTALELVEFGKYRRGPSGLKERL